MNASPHRSNQLRMLTAQSPPAGLFDAVTWAGTLVFAWLVFDSMPEGSHQMLVSSAMVDLHAGARFELALLSVVPVLVGRRRPVTALVGVLTGAAFLTALGEGTQMSLMGAAVLVGVIAAGRPRWIAATAALGTFTTWSLLEMASTPDVPGPYGQLSRTVLVLALAFIGGALVRERRENRRALREQIAVGAITAERLRIARELHDMVAHSIGIVAIQAGAAKRCIQTQPVLAAEALDVIETTSRQTLTGLRHMLVALRRADGDGDDNAPMPGLDDLPALADNAAKAGVAVRLRFDGERRALPAEVDLSAYRIVQESVTNVVRHAGVPQCRVAIGFGPREVVIEVVDDGRGLLADPLR
ncbi:sensor histidine kinase, partial [Catenulispora pinisilvae]|uniref:sensor histidine kinase n=1 Tax=Catenulispora pinisilvae TaxID=2705253 RepID=UPI0018926E3D